MKKLIWIFLLVSLCAWADGPNNPTKPGGSNGDVQCNVNGKFGNCSSNATISGTLTVGGTAKFSSTLTTGPGMPADSTVSAAGMSVTWDVTNHRWTNSATSGTPNNVPTFTTTYAAANTAAGTGTRADGLPACGGGGTGGGANFCAYGNWTTVTANFDDAVASGDEGFLYGPSTNVAGKYLVISTAANDVSTVAPGIQALGILTSAISGGSGTHSAQVTSWTATRPQPDRVITFSLIKSGAIGVFPTYIGPPCTIYRVDVTADQSGTIALDIWKANAAIPTSGGKISGTTWTPLSGAQSSFNTSLSGWTNSGAVVVSSGDVFGGTVGTFTTVTNVLVQIRCH